MSVTQKTTWHLGHRIRAAWEQDNAVFVGPVETDKVNIGTREKNNHSDKKLRAGRGSVGKVPVVGLRDRFTGNVYAEPLRGTDQDTLQSFVKTHVAPPPQRFTPTNTHLTTGSSTTSQCSTVRRNTSKSTTTTVTENASRPNRAFPRKFTPTRLSSTERCCGVSISCYSTPRPAKDPPVTSFYSLMP